MIFILTRNNFLRTYKKKVVFEAISLRFKNPVIDKFSFKKNKVIGRFCFQGPVADVLFAFFHKFLFVFTNTFRRRTEIGSDNTFL